MATNLDQLEAFLAAARPKGSPFLLHTLGLLLARRRKNRRQNNRNQKNRLKRSHVWFEPVQKCGAGIMADRRVRAPSLSLVGGLVALLDGMDWYRLGDEIRSV